jgi:hypothetical protein
MVWRVHLIIDIPYTLATPKSELVLYSSYYIHGLLCTHNRNPRGLFVIFISPSASVAKMTTWNLVIFCMPQLKSDQSVSLCQCLTSLISPLLKQLSDHSFVIQGILQFHRKRTTQHSSHLISKGHTEEDQSVAFCRHIHILPANQSEFFWKEYSSPRLLANSKRDQFRPVMVYILHNPSLPC